MIEPNNKNEKHGDRMWLNMATVSVAIMIIVTIVSLLTFSMRVNKSLEMVKGQDVGVKDAYYVMITGDDTSVFWQDVYANAKNLCEQNNAELGLIANSLEGQYSVAELVNLAAISEVDGIIVRADESEAMCEAINNATEHGIPVVTVMEDSAVSARKSFVQVGSYNIGREYGRRILDNIQDQDCHIMVVMEAGSIDSSQNLIISGLQETIEASMGVKKSIQFSAVAVDSRDSFAAEESIRKLMMPGMDTPDVMITLNELITTCAYQAMIDFNRVGTIRLLGLGESDTIRKGISQGVIDATIAVDTDEMGSCCIEALDEYRQTGYVSEYYSVDTQLITKESLVSKEKDAGSDTHRNENIENGGKSNENP